MFPCEDGMYIIPDMHGGEYRFPKKTLIDNLLNDERVCRFCTRRHVTSVPKKCQGLYDLECRKGWYKDFKENHLEEINSNNING